MIKILSLILFILLIIIGKENGLKTYISFYLNYFLIIIYIIMMAMGINAIIMSFILCILTTIITLYLLIGNNVKTTSSFISIMIVLLIMFLIIYFISTNAHIQGFSPEFIESIGAYNFYVNYDYTNVAIGMYLVCSIGTIIDTSVSISTSLNELKENNKNITRNNLFSSGLNIGKDILSTTINTLYFAFIGSFIAFFLWHYRENLELVLNYKSFTVDIIELLMCFIASILIIPTTSLIASIKLSKKNNK